MITRSRASYVSALDPSCPVKYKPVWEPELKRHLAHIGGMGGSADFSNLTVFSHTDLTRALDFPERFERIAGLADAVIIDEAHHFRNLGLRGDPSDPSERSRYYRLYDLLGERHKTLYMLTATPINNSLNDFRHMVELFSRGDDAYFSRTLGVTSLSGRLNMITKTLKRNLGDDVPEAAVAEEATELLAGDNLFKGLVVQRSRAYARASQIQETGNAAVFPERGAPKVADYSIRKSYGKLLTLVDTAFKKEKPLFALPMYYRLLLRLGARREVDLVEQALDRPGHQHTPLVSYDGIACLRTMRCPQTTQCWPDMNDSNHQPLGGRRASGLSLRVVPRHLDGHGQDQGHRGAPSRDHQRGTDVTGGERRRKPQARSSLWSRPCYNAELRACSRSTGWLTRCRSRYLKASGNNAVMWPGSTVGYSRR